MNFYGATAATTGNASVKNPYFLAGNEEKRICI